MRWQILRGCRHISLMIRVSSKDWLKQQGPALMQSNVNASTSCSTELLLRKQMTFTKNDRLPSLKQGELRLFSQRWSQYSERTRLVLAHKMIPHQVINVDLYAKPEWFLSRNPLGNIPVLERDGEVIYESLICNDWLEKNYPDKPLDPPDSYTKYQWRMLLTLFDVEIADPYYKMTHSPKHVTKCQEKISRGMKSLEKILGDNQFFAGNKVGMIDYNIWPWFTRLGPPDAENKRNLAGWYERMYTLPAVKATSFSNENHAMFAKQVVSNLKEGYIDFDFDLDITLKDRL